MALDDILTSIHKDAEKAASDIRHDAESEHDKRRSVLEAEVQGLREAVEKEAQRAATYKLETEQFRLRAAAQSKLLAQRRELLDRVYEQTVTTLAQLPQHEHEELLQHLLRALPDQPGSIQATTASQPMMQRAIHAAGRKDAVDATPLDGIGGFQYVTDELTIDCRFASLVNRLRDETTPAVANILFGTSYA